MCHSDRDDPTLANPLGPPVRGRRQIEEAGRRAASDYRDGRAVEFENFAKCVTPDLGYVLVGSDSPPSRSRSLVHWDTRGVGADGPIPASAKEARREQGTVDLYWLPLGAGGHFVRLNGRIYEALAARIQRRAACDLYHSALQVELAEDRFVIEQTPVPRLSDEDRGVVAGGAVGAGWAGRFRIFRYEIRLWRGGHIPDVAEAVDSPWRLSSDAHQARRVLEMVPRVPTPIWGRDELDTGEMWNSNAVIAWAIARSGIDPESIRPPSGGRAPGWQAGLVVARRQDAGARLAGAQPTAP